LAALQVLLNRLLVGQQLIQPGVEPVGIHLLDGHAEQVFQRRATIPLLLDVQFTRRLAETRDRQDRRHRRPRHFFASRLNAL
jgi:hypothetical protein